MKIGIVGNYGNNNNGDEAILAGIIEQVKSHYHITEEDILVFTNNPPQTSNRFGVQAAPLYYKRSSATFTFFHTLNRNALLVKDLDLLIIGGGGILMDFYNREAQLFGSYGMMARKHKVPYIVYSCGAGPITTLMGKFFIRNLLKGAHSVSVRDPESKALLRKIGVRRNIEVVGDPSFALGSPVLSKNDKIEKIGVTVVPYYNLAYWPEANDVKYEQYVTSMAENLDALYESTNAQITLFSTKYPHDVDVTIDVRKRMKHQKAVIVNEKHLSPQELLEVCSAQDLLIGTRLHSIYLAVNVETPIIAIAYHHKVADFMKMVGLAERVISIDTLAHNPTIIMEYTEKMNEQFPHYVEEAKQLKQKMLEMTSKGEAQFTAIQNKR